MTEVPGCGPRLSVVIPNYNHGHLIAESLAAISRQTVAPFEVVVVDDGSTDDSLARLQSLAADMPWLRIHRHSENRGVNAACNTGLGLVSGDFILFTAADDCLSPGMVERVAAAAAGVPATGIVFSDPAEMNADGSDARIMPLDLPRAVRYFSPDELIRLMRSHFFYFHVSSVWFNVATLRGLGGFPLEVKWHGDLLAAYAAGFERGAVYAPDAVSYIRVSAMSYGAAGKRSDAQLDVLRAWLRTLRQPGWERQRAAFVAAAIWPDYSLGAVRALLSDPGYLTPRLAARLVRLIVWTNVAPLVGTTVRHWLRRVRSRYRGSQSSAR